MSNIWSKNNYVNCIINILIFSISLNVLHLGQLLLPVVCLLIFVDRRFRIYVNNWLVFFLFCFFGISFFLFSYKLGFYSVMGLCLPMTYYVFSNILDTNEDKIIKIIYLIAFGMAFHVLLNMVYDFSINGIQMVVKSSHYDIWTKDKTPATNTAINFVFLIGLSFYLFFHEKNQQLKISGLTLFLVDFVYCLVLGRRTIVLLTVVVIVVTFLFERLVFNIKEMRIDPLVVALMIIGILICVFIYVTYRYDVWGLLAFYSHFYIIIKFMDYSFRFERIGLLFQSFPLRLQYLWGGQKISRIMGTEIHNLWGDIFDYAGVVPYITMLILSFYYMRCIYNVMFKRQVSGGFKVLMAALWVAIVVQLFLEPVMTGSSIFLICVVMIATALEGLEKNEINP